MKLHYLLAAALMISVAACGSKAQSKTEEAAEAQEVIAPEPVQEGVIVLSDDAAFRPGQAVAQPTVFDFNATWCMPCKKFAPAFDQVAEEMAGQAAFYSIDVDNCPETAKAFGVQSIPTVIILMPNGAVEQHIGLGDFVQGSKVNEATTSDELTSIMAANLKSMITAQLPAAE